MTIAILGALLAGCASPGLKETSTDATPERLWRERQARLSPIDSWDIRGRISVRTETGGENAAILWERHGERHRIELYGPFGGGRIVLEQDSSGAVMRDNRKRTFNAASAQELLHRRVGWRVPFDSLAFWLKGLPAPGGHEGLILDDEGKALAFRQRGWRIDILDYQERRDVRLPRRLFLSALPGTVRAADPDAAGPGDRLDVKVVLRHWLALDS